MPLQRLATTTNADSDATNRETSTPGKNTLIEQTAAEGVRGPGAALPFADRIAESFGPAHADTVNGIQAHTGEAATAASEEIGANAYAMGDKVAFGGEPDLHTAAHEAAHVVQQRQGVSLKGGVGQAGDPYEQHADAVADRVVNGLSAASLLGVDPGSAGTSSAVQRDDWGPEGPGKPKKKETAASFEPIVGTDPLDEEREVILGQTVKQSYHVSNAGRAPGGTRYEWSQHVDGRKTDQPELTSIDKHHGAVETATFRARAYGTRTLKTSVTSTTAAGQRTGDADDIKMTVPRPKVAAVGLDSLSARWGTRPVLGQMNFGDDLQVTVKYDQLATNPGEASLDLEGDQFKLKQPAKQIAPGVLRAVVSPKVTGEASGKLMLHALEHFSLDPAAFKVDVHEPSDENDSGPQPVKAGQHSLADNAIEQALDAWGLLTEQRKTAVHQVMLESQKVDPPPAAPWWHSLLKAAVEIALAAATGGIASGIATLVEEKFLEEISKKALKEGVKEFAKTFVEESLNKSVEAAGITGEKGGKEGGEGGGEGGKGLPSVFLGVEMAALGVAGVQEGNYHRNHLRNQVDVLEKREENAGVRYAMALQQSLMAKHATTEATDKQYVASFQSYNNLLARLALHTTAKDETDVKQDVKAGTDLSSLVVGGAEDLKQVMVTRTHIQSDGLGKGPVTEVVSSHGGDGPKKIPGVLRLELEGPKYGSVKIKKAVLPGLTSKAFADTIHASTIGELEMNVIGIIDQRDKGAVIGRNDKGQYSGHEKETSVLEDIARAWELDTRDPAAIAKLIFEKQLAGERVKPEIG